MNVNLSNDDEIALQGARLLPTRVQQLEYLSSVCLGDAERLSRLMNLLSQSQDTKAIFSPVDTTSMEGIEASEAANRSIGKFQLVKPIGSGGMGTVFLAEDIELRRRVALKIPRVDMVANTHHRRRFVKEAKLAAGLQHHGLVSVLEVGTVGSVTYIASTLCEQGDLAKWLEQSRHSTSLEDAARFVAELCDAVEYIHANGVLHLDLKPSNILLRKRNAETVKFDSADENLPGDPSLSLSELAPLVSDFGVSRAIDADATKTNTSLVLGTLLYMAPEQIAPSVGRVSHLSDVYAVGIVLAQILQLPLKREGANYRQIVSTLDEDQLTSPAVGTDNLPADLKTVLLKCTASFPDSRYASARELAADLRAFADGQPIQGKAPGLLKSIKTWTTRRARIKEAWWVCVATNSVTLIWMLVGIYLISGDTFPGASRTLSMASCAGLLAVNTLPMLFFSWLGLKGRIWPLLPAALLTAVFGLCIPILVLIGRLKAVPGMYENSPFFEIHNHALVLGFGLVQAVALTIALLAARRSGIFGSARTRQR